MNQCNLPELLEKKSQAHAYGMTEDQPHPPLGEEARIWQFGRLNPTGINQCHLLSFLMRLMGSKQPHLISF